MSNYPDGMSESDLPGWHDIDCPHCDGTGINELNDEECPICDGSGVCDEREYKKSVREDSYDYDDYDDYWE